MEIKNNTYISIMQFYLGASSSEAMHIIFILYWKLYIENLYETSIVIK